MLQEEGYVAMIPAVHNSQHVSREGYWSLLILFILLLYSYFFFYVYTHSVNITANTWGLLGLVRHFLRSSVPFRPTFFKILCIAQSDNFWRSFVVFSPTFSQDTLSCSARHFLRCSIVFSKTFSQVLYLGLFYNTDNTKVKLALIFTMCYNKLMWKEFRIEPNAFLKFPI